ncbi:hypothetical protein GQ457_12G000140 [Hibiscus cannabinus]
MKAILPHCISSAQAAFVQGCAITDNILIAHELVHTLHSSASRSSQGAVFKLDMEKAFDRVEWPFLKAVMLRLGFAPSWVDLIMRCVSSVSSRVRVRGALSEAIRPQRGLRQGDPLSPFLFLFCSEGLSAALTAAQQEGQLPGVRASKHGPPVNHLLFADDSLVFLRNNIAEVQCLKDILLTYSAVSGQKVNFSKSTAYFSPRTPTAHRTAVHAALGVQEVDDPGIYLGVPLLIGKNKYAAFGRYRDRVDTRVSKWSNLLLSFSGREVLIKSIAQALPQYVMSCYLLPCSSVEEMSRSIRRFWWSGKGSARGWPLVAWDDICLPKAAGGIGFKDLHLFNIALLGKQLWRLLSTPDSLLCRTLRAKYFPDGDLFGAPAPARSSFAWKGLHRAMLRLRDGFFWTLGVNSQVRLFRDRWGGFSPLALDGDTIDREELPLRCRDFMVPGQACWDRAKLLTILPPGDVDCILEVPISLDRADTLVWGDHDSGLYTVRSGYLFLRRPPSPPGPPPRLWKILAKLPKIPKVHSFGWRCGRDALPVGSRLRDAGACPLCGFGFEDILHVLRDCPDSSTALSQAGFNGSLLSTDQVTVVGWLGFAASSLSLNSFALLLFVLWGLWRRRNTWVHECSLYPLHLVVEDAVLLCRDYASASASAQVSPPAAAAPPIGAHHLSDPLNSGAVLGGFAKPIPVQGPASTVEVAALFAGLEFAIANDWPSTLVEFDAAVLVNKLHRPAVDLSLLGDLLAPSRVLLTANTARLRVGFTPRLANIAVHTLAYWACNNNDERRYRIRIFSYIPKGGTYQREGGIKVKVKDLKPKRIKDYLECKISQRSPTLLKYLLFNDS